MDYDFTKGSILMEAGNTPKWSLLDKGHITFHICVFFLQASVEGVILVPYFRHSKIEKGAINLRLSQINFEGINSPHQEAFPKYHHHPRRKDMQISESFSPLSLYLSDTSLPADLPCWRSFSPTNTGSPQLNAAPEGKWNHAICPWPCWRVSADPVT